MEIQAADFDRFLYLISELGDRDIPFRPIGGNRVRVDDRYYDDVTELPEQAIQYIVGGTPREKTDGAEETAPEEPSEALDAPEGADIPDESESATESNGDTNDDTPVEIPPRPPLGGPGSGRDAWAEYAETVFDLEITEDMTRDDIVDAVEAMEE